MSMDRRLIEACRDEHGRIDKQMLHARGVSDNNLFGGDDVHPEPLGGRLLVRARGCSIRGRWDDRGYWVALFWGGEVGRSAELRGWDAGWVRERLRAHVGSAYLVTATGPPVRLALDHPLSVRVALCTLSEVAEIRGDDPPGSPRPAPYDVVY